MAIQRLPAAYRSRSRPSSTPGAKASTMCPSYLDGDHAHERPRKGSDEHAVIPVCWHGCAVFKVREEAPRPVWAVVSQNSTACARARRARRAPGPVDVSVAALLDGAECAGAPDNRSNPGASLER